MIMISYDCQTVNTDRRDRSAVTRSSCLTFRPHPNSRTLPNTDEAKKQRLAS